MTATLRTTGVALGSILEHSFTLFIAQLAIFILIILFQHLLAATMMITAAFARRIIIATLFDKTIHSSLLLIIQLAIAILVESLDKACAMSHAGGIFPLRIPLLRRFLSHERADHQ